MRPDSASYDDSAKSILRVGRFAVSPGESEQPQILRTPGYPAFIAMFYLIFGETHVPVIIAQILISIATAVLMYKMAVLLWGRTTAAFAVFLLALDPISFSYSQLFLTETLFTFLLILSVYMGFHFVLSSQPPWMYVIGIGLSLSLATLVRPITYWLIFPALIWLFLFEVAERRGWKKGITWCVLMLAPWIALIGGWQFRNLCVVGKAEYCFIANESLLRYRAADIVSMREHISFEEAGEKIEELIPGDEGKSQVEVLSAHGIMGASLIKKHPLLLLKSTIRGAGKMLFVPGEYELLQCLGVAVGKEGCLGDLVRLSPRRYLLKWPMGRPEIFMVFLVSAGYLFLLYVCALCAVARIHARDRRIWFAHISCWGVILYLLLLSAGPEAGPRFRVPLMPLLCIYAGKGLMWIGERLKHRG